MRKSYFANCLNLVGGVSVVKSKNWICVAACAVLLTVSGCANLSTPRRWDGCAIGGAVVGGVAGAGIGLGIANAVGRSGDNVFNEERGTAMWASAIGGAVLGTVVGHYLCDPIIQPPA